MQPMPAKNRNAIMMIGAALMAVVLVAVFWSSRKNAETQPQQLDQLSLEQVNEAGVSAPTGSDSATPTQADSGTKEQPALSAAAGTVPMEHVVAQGETLMSISEKYYGSKLYAGDIEELNKLENPNSLKVGDRLKLPRREELPALGQ